MGPRSRDRGNLSACTSFAKPRRLQWGRDHVIAEMFSTTMVVLTLRMLQWGRDHVIAEIASLLSYSIFKDLWQVTRAASRFPFSMAGPHSLFIPQLLAPPTLTASRASTAISA